MQPALKIYEMNLARDKEGSELLHVTLYSPSEEVGLKGVMLLAHDLGEDADCYRRLAKEMLIPRGFALMVPDLPGFGQSSGTPGVSSMNECVAALRLCSKVLQRKTRSIPLFLMGHGMGATILLEFLLRYASDVHEFTGPHTGHFDAASIFHAAIVSAPWIQNATALPDFVYKCLNFLSRVFPKATFRRKMQPELLTDDRKVQMNREQNPFCHDRMGYKLCYDLWHEGRRIQAAAREIRMPMLLMYGLEDRLVSVEAIQEMVQDIPEYMNKVEWPAFLHDLHNMEDRAEYYDTLAEYLDVCLRRGLKPIPSHHPHTDTLDAQKSGDASDASEMLEGSTEKLFAPDEDSSDDEAARDHFAIRDIEELDSATADQAAEDAATPDASPEQQESGAEKDKPTND